MRHELTAYQIVDAFPNEVKEYYPAIVRDLELKLLKKRALLRQLEVFNQLCFEDKIYQVHGFYMQILAKCYIEVIFGENFDYLLAKYQRCLELVKIRHSDWQDDQAVISLAKTQPIEDIYQFNKIRKHGSRMLALCPFHQENTPSFVIYIVQNTFHCFGCGAQGDAIDFFMKLNKVSFKKALEGLK